ncbi:MAG: hypothetical protein IKK60_08640 [Clostridia bacterium]|nr:hypothetical protein [Clostridia bacterium]
MNFRFKRFLAVVLALLMIVPTVPSFTITANAASALNGIGVSDLVVTYDGPSNASGKATWTATADGKGITGKATGYKWMSVISNSITTKLYLQNNKSGEAILSFDYSLSGGGSVSADRGTMSDGKFSLTIGKGESVTVTLTSPKGTATNTLSITNLSLVLNATGDVTTNFKTSANGSYTVDGTAISKDTAITGAIGSKHTLVATPTSGYKFVGWYQEKDGTSKCISNSKSISLEVDADTVVYPVFVATAIPVFQVGQNNYFYDLDDAVNYALGNGDKQVTLISSGTISDSSYTIPSGMTLLVPYSTDYNTVGEKPVSTATWTTPSPYVILTMAKGTKITVNGTIEVGSKFRYCSGGKTYGNAPTGKYGAIYMNEGSNITLNSGAKLYAWGYVYGNGSVNASSGAQVYEFMQIGDFYGGGKLGDMAHMFPFSQYYIQNIEVPLTLNYGATEYLYVKLVISDYELPATVPFISTGADSMFRMSEGSSVTKDYDPSTDRLVLDINGNASLQSVSMEPDLSAFDIGTKIAITTILNSMLGGTTINSANYILCLNSNMTINVNSGMTTISQEMSALPGVEVYVDKSAVLHLASGDSSKTTVSGGSAGKNAYLFDSEQWGAYIFSGKKLINVSYSPTANYYKRTEKDLKDVILDINGTVVTDGYLYTTVNYDYQFDEEGNLISLDVNGGGASIISSEGTGVLAMNNGAGTEIGVYNLDGAGASETTIFAASAQLKNGDGSYLNTMGAEPGTEFKYCADDDKWYTGECDGEKCNAPKEYLITWVVNGKTSSGDVAVGTVPVYEGSLEMDYTDNKHYTFAGWSTTANGSVLGNLPEVTADATYYAVFTEASHSYATASSDGRHKCTDCEKKASCGDTEGDGDHLCDLGCGAEFPGCTGGTATCTVKAKCTECGQFYGELKPHTEKTREENRKEATCGADGSYDLVTYCEVCKKVLSTESKTITATGKHNYNSVVTKPTCTEEGFTTYTCSVCNDSYVADKVSAKGHKDADGDGDHLCDTCKAENVTPHSKGEMVKENIKEETCVDAGKYDEVYYCTECKGVVERKNIEVPANAKNHKWGETTYSWSADGKSCTATHACGNDGTHTETETATIGSEVVNAATCTEMGTTRYTATFAKDWAKTQTKDVKDILAKNHDMQKTADEIAPKCEEAGKTAVYTCANGCGKTEGGDVIEALKHDMQKTADEIAPKCEEEGKTAVYTCANGCGKTEGGEAIENTGHTKGEMVKENVTDAGCVDAGRYDAVYYCSVCGEEVERTNIPIPAKNHAWSDATYSWSEDGKTCTATRYCANAADHIETETATIESEVVNTATCTEMGTTRYIATFAKDWAKTQTKDVQDIAELGHGSEEGFDYVDNKNGTHKAICNDCGKTSDVNVDCDYDETTHKCVCDAVETFTVTLKDYNTKEQKFGTLEIPYGAKVFDYLETVEVEDFAYKVSYIDGVFSFSGEWLDAENNKITEELTMPGEDITVFAYMLFTGWEHCGNDNWSYAIKDETQTGWHEVDGEWYYLNPEYVNGYYGLRAQGITRVPYPETAIDGVTYAPNADDKAYWAAHQDKSSYTDAETACFVFGADGKFNPVTGIVDGNRYALKGMIGWHPGLVEVDGDYYYFLGDKNGGGNVMATGDTYVTRGTTDEFVNGGIYTFGEDGKLCEYDGITEVDGVLRYYKDNRLATGAGLIKVDGDYYYVRTNGELVVNKKYWVSNINGYSVVAGEYQFDKNGKMINPVDPEIYDGIVKVDGFYYYYINGKKQVNTGVQKLTDENGKTFYIYVTSNGKLATGEYWPTNRNDLLDRGCYDWGTDGKYYPTVPEKKDGIVEIDGLYYYYIDGKKQANTGVQKLEDENGKTFYIYVTSSGKLATGEYWPSNRNGLLDKGCYNWGTDGKYYPTVPEKKNGIIEIDGLYYYYIDGEKQANTGVQKLKDEEGKTFYIYVTSSGKLATGEYWPSNRNDLLERGCYDWGTNGRYYPA